MRSLNGTNEKIYLVAKNSNLHEHHHIVLSVKKLKPDNLVIVFTA